MGTESAAVKGKSKLWFFLIWASLPLISFLSFMLPWVLRLVNNKLLKRVEGFDIKIEQVKVHMSPAQIVVKGISFQQLNGLSSGSSFSFSLAKLTLNIKWNKLLEGLVICDIAADSPQFFFVRSGEDNYKKIYLPVNLPLLVHKFHISNGQATFRDVNTLPEIFLKATDIILHAENVHNLVPSKLELPGRAELKANFFGGTARANCGFNLASEKPTFDLNMEIVGIHLVELNSIFEAYGKFDVNKGRISVFTELAAKHGLFKGYIKPVVRDLDVHGPEDRHKGLLRQAWEGIVGVMTTLVENPKKKQIATNIPIDGKFEDPNIHVGCAVLDVLQNAFIKALTSSLDFKININSVKSDSVQVDK